MGTIDTPSGWSSSPVGERRARSAMHAAERGLVVDRRQQPGEVGAVAADLDRQRALPGRGGIQRERQHHDLAGVEHLAHARADARRIPRRVDSSSRSMLALATTSAAASPFMSCSRRASQSPRASTKVTSGGLTGSAHCRNPDRLVRRRADDDNTRSSACVAAGEPAALHEQQVARVGARQRGGDVRQRVGGERQVFPQMHGDVDGVGAQRDAEITGEAAAAQELGQRRVELAVAGRGEKGVFDFEPRMARAQQRRRPGAPAPAPARWRARLTRWVCRKSYPASGRVAIRVPRIAASHRPGRRGPRPGGARGSSALRGRRCSRSGISLPGRGCRTRV